MSTENDTSPAAESVDTEPEPVYLSMDIDAVDAAGIGMMSTAAALRREFAAAGEQISALLDGWTDPAAATIAADWDTARGGADRWLEHMHGLGSLVRQVAAATSETEENTAAGFRRQARECEAIAHRFRRIRDGRAAGGDPDATEAPGEGNPA